MIVFKLAATLRNAPEIEITAKYKHAGSNFTDAEEAAVGEVERFARSLTISDPYYVRVWVQLPSSNIWKPVGDYEVRQYAQYAVNRHSKG